jgi:hypothetical protein
MLFLGQFSMKIEHMPGEMNVIADLLSRILEYSGYVSGSLKEPVDVEVPDQDFVDHEIDPPRSTTIYVGPYSLSAIISKP